jgi:hypothetical protein
MTRDDIIRLAREAGFEVNFDIWAVSVDGIHINKHLERFAALVAAAEREACAKIADGQLMNQTQLLTNPPQSGAAWTIAAAIRARGESK